MDQQLFHSQQKQCDKHDKPKMCICMDTSNLDQTIDREPFCYMTTDAVFHKVSQAKFFTIVNISKRYYHIDLDEASIFLTTFRTQFGKYRFTRKPFCLTVAGDAFQHKLDTIFINLYFFTDIANDIVV